MVIKRPGRNGRFPSAVRSEHGEFVQVREDAADRPTVRGSQNIAFQYEVEIDRRAPVVHLFRALLFGFSVPLLMGTWSQFAYAVSVFAIVGILRSVFSRVPCIFPCYCIVTCVPNCPKRLATQWDRSCGPERRAPEIGRCAGVSVRGETPSCAKAPPKAGYLR